MSVLHTLLGAHTLRHVAPALGSIGAIGSARLLRRAQRIFHRLPVELVDVDPGRVLIVAPHMDDEVIGPGGTAVRHVRAGSTVAVVFASDGAGITTGAARDEYVSTRKHEAESASALMGTTILGFLDHPDGDLCRHERELARDLEQVIDGFSPDQIFVPFPTDHHRDHQATAAAASQAIRRANWPGTVWAYEAWSPLWPNVSVDITDVLDEKVAALECHGSQVSSVNYVDATVGLNRFRGLRVAAPAAEAFYRVPAADFSRMCARLTGRI
jgi:LmbE family N-acetylglucosaminyl deacetylase